VIDASVAIKRYVPEEDCELAMKLYARAKSGEMEFHIPDLMYCEVGNIHWKKVRVGELERTGSRRNRRCLLAVPKPCTTL
jgi:predicted nucleic acid-binding protein